MSIVARPPDPDPPRGSRTGGGTSVDTLSLQPAVVLLPSAGAPAPVLTSRRALALDALQFLRLVRGTLAADAAWTDPAFGRAVEAIRRQLGPIRSRAGLAASFEREAVHVKRPVLTPDGGPTGPLTPLRLAYAIRWLELGDGESRPPWQPIRRERDRAARAAVARRVRGRIGRGRGR